VTRIYAFQWQHYQLHNESAAVRWFRLVLFKLFMFIINVMLCALRHELV